MIVGLTEILRPNRFASEDGLLSRENNYVLREVFVNPGHVVCLREDSFYKNLLSEGKLMNNLDHTQSFTKLYLNRGQAGIEITVVGSPASIQEKLDLSLHEKQLLKG